MDWLHRSGWGGQVGFEYLFYSRLLVSVWWLVRLRDRLRGQYEHLRLRLRLRLVAYWLCELQVVGQWQRLVHGYEWITHIYQQQIDINLINNMYNIQTMNQGQSISFASFDSQLPSNTILPFHQAHFQHPQYPVSNQSMIRNLPGTTVSMSSHLQIVLLLQAAQIQRLTASLHQYRSKFKRIMNNQKDYDSFKNQANQLLQVKDQLQLTNRKMGVYVQNKKGQLMDKDRYVQMLQSKYKRALKLIQQAHISKQQTQLQYMQLQSQLKTCKISFQAYKKQSIREYQLLREQLQSARTQSMSLEVSKFTSEKERLLEILSKQQERFVVEGGRLADMIGQQRAKNEVLQNYVRKLEGELRETNRVVEDMKHVRSGQNEKDKKISVLQAQLLRNKQLLRQKTILVQRKETAIVQFQEQIRKISQQSQIHRQQQQRYINRMKALQEQSIQQTQTITHLQGNLSYLKARIGELQLIVQQAKTQNRVASGKYNQERVHYQKQIQTYKQHNMSMTRQLQKANREEVSNRQHIQHHASTLSQKIADKQHHIQKLNDQISKLKLQVQNMVENNKNQHQKLTKELLEYKAAIGQLMNQKQSLADRLKKEAEDVMREERVRNQIRLREAVQMYQKIKTQWQQQNRSKHELQKTVIQLKSSLERTHQQLKQTQKQHTFQAMIQQIQTLCNEMTQKQSKIVQLTQQVNKSTLTINQLSKQTANLKQMIARLMQMVNSNSLNRKQQDRIVVDHIKQLFSLTQNKFNQLTQKTTNISLSTSQYQERMLSTQRSIVENKQMEIMTLRDKLQQMERQMQGQNELKDIVGKVIAITKQNSQIKAQLNKKNIQLNSTNKIINDLKGQLQRHDQVWQLKVREKQQLAQNFIRQMEQQNKFLMEDKEMLQEQREKGNQLRRVLYELEYVKQQSIQQILKKQEDIGELTQTISKMMQENKRLFDENAAYKQKQMQLQGRINILRGQNEKISSSASQIHSLKQRIAQLQRQRRYQSQNLLKQMEETQYSMREQQQQLKNQCYKLRQENSVLMKENSQLKEELLGAGSKIIQITKDNQQLRTIQLQYKQQKHMLEQTQVKITNMDKLVLENKELRRQLDQTNRQKQQLIMQQSSTSRKLLAWNQKSQTLQREFNNLQLILKDLRSKNSALMNDNYQLNLAIQKNKVFQQKVAILNSQIDRLQLQKLQLTHQINACRFEISQQNNYDRQIEQKNTLLVMLFVQVEALRTRLNSREEENQMARKKHINN